MTIKDISALTGYSVGTVSRVLNDQPNVSEKARKAILEVVNAAGFQLNENAKQLKQQKATSILVIVKGTSNELFGRLLEQIQARVADKPYPLIVDYLDEEENEVLRALRLCREKKPLGILFLGGNLDNFHRDFDRIGLPCILITGNASQLALEHLSSITTDDRKAGFMAVDHLASLGHRQIVVIGGSRDISDISRLRNEGCLEACKELGVAYDPDLDYCAGRFSYADGYQAVKTLLERGRKFTAIFAMADVMAIGAVRALQDCGLQVPEDVSVMGMDGLAIGDFTVPTLTTVRQSVEELAERSVQILFQQIQGNPRPCHETIAPAVEQKESTRQIG